MGLTAGFPTDEGTVLVANRKTAEAVIGFPFLSTPLTVNPPVAPLDVEYRAGGGAGDTERVTGGGMLTTRGLILNGAWPAAGLAEAL